MLMRKFHLILDKNLNKILNQNEITLAQAHILQVLYFQLDGNCEYKKLEKWMGVAQSTTVNLINTLEKKGFVETYSSEKDKRVKNVRITEKGKNICEWSNNKAETEGSAFFKGLTEEEKEIFFMLLEKICNNLSKD